MYKIFFFVYEFLFLFHFKSFALQGNAFDSAIGIIIGTAFTNVVQSLVNDNTLWKIYSSNNLFINRGICIISLS